MHGIYNKYGCQGGEACSLSLELGRAGAQWAGLREWAAHSGWVSHTECTALLQLPTLWHPWYTLTPSQGWLTPAQGCPTLLPQLCWVQAQLCLGKARVGSGEPVREGPMPVVRDKAAHTWQQCNNVLQLCPRTSTTENKELNMGTSQEFENNLSGNMMNTSGFIYSTWTKVLFYF